MRPSRRWAVLATALSMLLPALAVLPTAEAQTPSVKLMVLGETHGTKSMTKDLVNIAQAKGATGCVCPGDFIYGHWDATPSAWRSMMSPFMGEMLPAQGNHDTPWSDWKSIFPGEQRYYSKVVNGVQVIALNPEYSSLSAGSTQRVWLERVLAEQPDSAIKIVTLHRPWWLPDGARHPTSSFEAKAGTSGSTMHSLMRQHGVDLVVSAHEKNYQHSQRDGVHYLVAGGGGPEFYPMGYTLPGAIKRLTSNVVTVMDVTPTQLTLKSYDRYWNSVEQWTITGSSTSSSTPTGSGSDGTFAATFRPHDGNAWWVQTKVDATHGLTKVEARVDGGAWQPLTLRSWGSWAAGMKAPDGSRVEFRATSTSGALATSGAFLWPDGTPASSGTTSGGAFAATFRPDGGNQWWVQAKVDSSTRIAKVEASVDGGAWQPLTLRSWGAWAAGMKAPDGSEVRFRATSDAGATATSGAFVWPTGTPVSGGSSGDGALSATFRPHDGNAWWVQAKVDSAKPLAKVEARVDGGAWKTLTLRSWGSWAASVHAPTGSSVEFRATATDGTSATSARYVWPAR